ncbi:MAG: hypothetical protein EOO07_33660, partial [Chitinophagaceae bacterium]
MKYFVFCSLLSSCAFADIKLNNTLLCDGNPATKTKEQLSNGAEMFKVLSAKGVESISSCLGWTNFNSGGNWYIVTENIVYGTDTEKKQYLGGWPLGSPNPCGSKKDCATPWWSGRWSPDEVIENELLNQTQPSNLSWSSILDTDNAIMGCMQQSPLRYGDLESDNKKELIIFHPNGYSVDFIVFSPELKKTTFATKLDYNDIIPHASQIADKLRAEFLPPNPA